MHQALFEETDRTQCVMADKKTGWLLRSSSQVLLQVPVSSHKCYGDCVFSVAGPCFWNRLLGSIKSAMSLLKTQFFKDCFSRSIIFSLYLWCKWFYCTAPISGRAL